MHLLEHDYDNSLSPLPSYPASNSVVSTNAACDLETVSLRRCVATRALLPKSQLLQLTFCRRRQKISVNNLPKAWIPLLLPETLARLNQFTQGRSVYIGFCEKAIASVLKRKALQKALKRPIANDILESLQQVIKGK